MTDFGGMSAADINASMWGNFSPGAAQAVLNNNFNNFGQQTDYYSALGAAYGRQTGGFGGVADPSGGGGGSVFDTGTTPYNYWDGSRGAPSAPAPSFNPMTQYQNGGYDPFSAQTFQPAATLPSSPQASLPQSGWGNTSVNPWVDPAPSGGQYDASGRNMALPGNQFFDAEGNPAVNQPGQSASAPSAGWGMQLPYASPFSPQSSLPQSGWGNTAYNPWLAAAADPSFNDRMSAVPNYSVAPDVQNWGASFTSPIGGGAEWPTDPWQRAIAQGQQEQAAMQQQQGAPPQQSAAQPDWRNAMAMSLVGNAQPNAPPTPAAPAALPGWANYAGSYGATPAPPTLATQRADFANTIRDDPNKSLQLAARLYSEAQNDPTGRQGILEAMLNRYNSLGGQYGSNPFDPAYYPTDTTDYNKALNTVSNDNALLGQLQQEMEGVFGGSNVSNYATDWASGDVAKNERTYATPTFTSPVEGEQFFRKDISNPTTGAGIAAMNQAWYNNLVNPAWPGGAPKALMGQEYFGGG